MWSLVRLVLLCDESFGKKVRLQYKRNFPSVYRVSQKFVPLITGDITFDRNYTSAWNFLTTFIALLSTYIRKVNIRHALLYLLSRFEAVAVLNGIRKLIFGVHGVQDKISIYFMGRARVRDFRTKWYIRNRTSDRRERVRFLIQTTGCY